MSSRTLLPGTDPVLLSETEAPTTLNALVKYRLGKAQFNNASLGTTHPLTSIPEVKRTYLAIEATIRFNEALRIVEDAVLVCTGM